VLIHQPDVGFVHERGRLKCLPRALSPKLRRGPAAQLRVDERKGALAGVEIPGGPGVQQPGNVVGGGGSQQMPSGAILLSRPGRVKPPAVYCRRS
jgi:hypothetical protein